MCAQVGGDGRDLRPPHRVWRPGSVRMWWLDPEAAVAVEFGGSGQHQPAGWRCTRPIAGWHCATGCRRWPDCLPKGLMTDLAGAHDCVAHLSRSTDTGGDWARWTRSWPRGCAGWGALTVDQDRAGHRRAGARSRCRRAAAHARRLPGTATSSSARQPTRPASPACGRGCMPRTARCSSSGSTRWPARCVTMTHAPWPNGAPRR